MNKISGVYRIVCYKNGDYYYGSSKNILRRWGQHKRRLRVNEHVNNRLQSVWNKYGELSFRLELIELVPEENLQVTETKYLTEHFGNPHCMNLTMDANAPMRNIKRGSPSKDTREKISKTLTGRKIEPCVREKISNTLTQYVKTDIHKRNLSLANTGKSHSIESRQKISLAKKGTIHTKETKEKMSKSHKGINTWAKGRKMSDAEKKLRSEAQKIRWEKYRNSVKLNLI